MLKMCLATFVLNVFQFCPRVMRLMNLFTNMYRPEDGDIMKNKENTELMDFLEVLPPVEFCCIYGSTLHPNNRDKVLFGSSPPPLLFFMHILFHTCDPLSWFEVNLWISSQKWWTLFLAYLILKNGTKR